MNIRLKGTRSDKSQTSENSSSGPIATLRVNKCRDSDFFVIEWNDSSEIQYKKEEHYIIIIIIIILSLDMHQPQKTTRNKQKSAHSLIFH